MLRDYLVRDYGELELSQADRKAIRGAQNDKALQAVAKICISGMLKAHDDLTMSKVALDHAQMEGLTQAYRAYRMVAEFIFEPGDEEEQE